MYTCRRPSCSELSLPPSLGHPVGLRRVHGLVLRHDDALAVAAAVVAIVVIGAEVSEVFRARHLRALRQARVRISDSDLLVGDEPPLVALVVHASLTVLEEKVRHG